MSGETTRTWGQSPTKLLYAICILRGFQTKAYVDQGPPHSIFWCCAVYFTRVDKQLWKLRHWENLQRASGRNSMALHIMNVQIKIEKWKPTHILYHCSKLLDKVERAKIPKPSSSFFVHKDLFKPRVNTTYIFWDMHSLLHGH